MIKKFLIYLLLFVSTVCYADYEVKEAFIDAKDAKIFCRIAGNGKPLIVIHGGPGLTQDYLLPQMYKLAENNRVVFYDQRGCGKSTADINSDTITIEAFVSDIEAIRQELNVDKISLLGHSWGGFLAMHYAIAYPQRVDRMILSNGAPASAEEYVLFGQEWIKRMAPYQEQIAKIQSTEAFKSGDPATIESFYRLIFRRYCYMPEKADLLNLHLSSDASLNGAKVQKIFQQNVLDQPFNLHPSLKKIQLPVLVLHGDDDPIPPMTAENIHRSIPHSTYVLMKNCGHFPYVEDPDTYFNSIDEFLNSREY